MTKQLGLFGDDKEIRAKKTKPQQLALFSGAELFEGRMVPVEIPENAQRDTLKLVASDYDEDAEREAEARSLTPEMFDEERTENE